MFDFEFATSYPKQFPPLLSIQSYQLNEFLFIFIILIIMQGTNSRFIIQLGLRQKYEDQFYFFLTGNIDQIVFEQHKSKNYTQYKQSYLASHDTEYLRREYWLNNSIGQPEIYDRISVLANFYTNNHYVTSHYPLMVITNTKFIFGKRIRRLRKMVAFDNSSDGQSTPVELSQSFSTLGFLKESELNQSRMSKNISQFSYLSSLTEKKSFDSEVHNIYNGKIEIELIEPDVEEEVYDFNELVIDFQDLDPERTVQNYQQLQKKYKESPEKIIHEKPFYASLINDHPISIFHNKNAEKKQERAEKLAELKKNQRKNILFNECKKTIGNRITQDKEYESSRKRSQKKDDESNETKRKRRQRIRDKATELLNKVKSQDYINYKIKNKNDND